MTTTYMNGKSLRHVRIYSDVILN